MLNRRTLLAGLGVTTFRPGLARVAFAQDRPSLALSATADSLVLRPGSTPTKVWSLAGDEIKPKRGETLAMTLSNGLPGPLALHWRGMEGLAAAESLLGQESVAAGSRQSFQLPLRQAGTILCDPGLLNDGQPQPVRPRPLIVLEAEPVAVDRDVVLLIEEWRLRPDGTALTPGTDARDAAALYTLNGQTSFELAAKLNERLRLRFINGSQRTVLAIKLDNHDVRVMATDGQPSEPFPARNGALVLAPGARADAYIDASGPASILLHDGKEPRPIGKLAIAGEPARRATLPPAPPLPANGLPAQLELKNAQRLDLTLGTPADWIKPVDFAASAAPGFRAKTGRVVVLSLANRAAIATVFHLHGHHFRLLDRLDDGWKPFWLDTLAIEPGQTQRIAFLAEYPGRYLIEQVATDWAAARLVRWYSVE